VLPFVEQHLADLLAWTAYDMSPDLPPTGLREVG
jgi:hypothetical protein